MRARIALLACIVLACVGARSDARRVVHIPTLGELCPGNAEWSKVLTCIERAGARTFTLVRDEPRVKVVRITERSRLGGLYIYMLGKQWQLRGELRLYQDHEVLAFTHVTFGKHMGVRLDAGMAMPTSFSFDGETTMPATLRQEHTLVCFEDRQGCVQVMTSCDLLLRGKAYHSFRGELVYANRQLKVIGDRGKAGNYCVQAELVLAD